MCTVPAFGEHSYGQEEPTTNSVFTGCIYRELAGLDHLYFQMSYEKVVNPWCRLQPEDYVVSSNSIFCIELQSGRSIKRPSKKITFREEGMVK